MDELELGADEDFDPEDSTVIIPNRKARQNSAAAIAVEVEYVPKKGEAEGAKKKKRLVSVALGTIPGSLTWPSHRQLKPRDEAEGVTQDSGMQLRRSVRGK